MFLGSLLPMLKDIVPKVLPMIGNLFRLVPAEQLRDLQAEQGNDRQDQVFRPAAPNRLVKPAYLQSIVRPTFTYTSCLRRPANPNTS